MILRLRSKLMRGPNNYPRHTMGEKGRSPSVGLSCRNETTAPEVRRRFFYSIYIYFTRFLFFLSPSLIFSHFSCFYNSFTRTYFPLEFLQLKKKQNSKRTEASDHKSLPLGVFAVMDIKDTLILGCRGSPIL